MRKINFFISRIVLLILISTSMALAQGQIEILQKNISVGGTPKFIEFNPQQSYRASEARIALQEQLNAPEQDEFKLSKINVDDHGYEHQKFQRYHQNVKVEYGDYSTHAKNGVIESMNGEYLNIKNISISPSIDEASALQKALGFMGASEYMWENPSENAGALVGKESFYPKGELVFVKNFNATTKGEENEVVLAYKFDVYAQKPVRRDYIYVDAHTGAIVHSNAIIKHAVATATAATRYSGNKSIKTDSNAGSYRLRDYTRGNGIETYDMNTGTNYGNAVDFTDNDNNWTSAEHDNSAKDNAALDAHWGAQMTFDYFSTRHGRNSYDNNGSAIKSYVHYDNAYDNAFWNGSVMTYGDGSGTYFDALTSLDVAAHEIGHAVCTNTANLVYQNESGAMNEGFSDIWGASVEYFAAPEKSAWLIGEDIERRPGSAALRSMSDPNSEGQPDTYKGTSWYSGTADNGGVHTNSGVLNHWFYILSIGKSGTNDIGNSYAVSGISIEKAAQIAYRLESVYLSSNSTYADARTFGIKAAEDIYGLGSLEVIATTNAWFAVGIGSAYGQISYCSSQGNNSSYEWMASVNVGSFTNNSGAAGYTDFTAMTVALAAGSTNAVSLSPGFSGTTYNEYWKIWIDFNENGSFDDAGELVFNSGALSKTTVTGTVSIPAAADGITTRMRVSMKYNAAQTACESFSYGEVEDYTVTIEGNTTPTCTTPSGLATSSPSNNSVSTNWNAVNGANSYDIRYKSVSGSTWSTKNVTSTSTSLTALSAGTDYETQVSANCASGSSSYSASVNFTTPYTCNVPTALNVASVAASAATVDWSSVAFANSYGVRYRVAGTTTWNTTNASSNSKAISGLSASTTYEVQVRTVCGNGNSAYSASVNFTTSGGSISYCGSNGNDASYEWIDYVSLNNMTRTSGNDGGYYDATASVANVAAGSTNTMYVSAGFRSSSYTEYWKVWIDLNQDGDFTDANELLVNGSSSSSANLSATLNIPATALLGVTRMRVSMKYNSAQTTCESFAYGEVEDYTVNIGSAASIAGFTTDISDSHPLGDELPKNLYTIYPNPTKDLLNLYMTEKSEHFKVQVLDLSGKLIFKHTFDNQKMSINVASLAAGVYFIQIEGGKEQVIEKFIKE